MSDSVLIVDDEPVNIQVLASALGDAYELRFATDAGRALALAASTRTDLILLDVVMPVVDGFELLRRLKADPATAAIPVIFVTAMHDTRDEERGFALGAVDYITKPVSPPIVRARVRTQLELKRQRDLLERRALCDGLTGIANRRRFDEELERAWRSRERARQPLSLLLLDVDHFKQYNDHYGHGSGDDCLVRLAGALEHAFARAGELAARVGGEEFAVLVPDDEVARHARRLLQSVQALAVPHARSDASPIVSVSAGALAALPREDQPPRALLERADRLLYAAKQAGRNRCAYESLGEEETKFMLPI